MKKFISGVIVGVLLFSGVSAFADGVSIFGKKISGIYTVEMNGKKIADAGIIDGSAYAPVRAVSEAAGVTFKVDPERKKIIMNTDGTGTQISEAFSVKISTLKASISTYQANIDSTKEHEIAVSEKNLVTAQGSDNGTPESALVISSLEQRIKESKAYITEQQKLIDQAKVEIEKLQGQLKP
ncbi:hypothetical protein NYE47_00975 [Paenibacillus sp. FSL H7-0941]|uniref:hypothetical protein n=1 Tax=Paenibacillus sp. FSL H7-0941 TaxID=2975351 RepID=UPI0030F534AC